MDFEGWWFGCGVEGGGVNEKEGKCEEEKESKETSHELIPLENVDWLIVDSTAHFT